MMLERLPDRDRFGDVTGMLRQWSGAMSRDRPEPLIFVAWLRAFNRAVYGDELGDPWRLYWDQRPRFIASVLTEKSAWCDDVATPSREDCATQLEASLDAALGELAEEFGGSARDWRWGAVHKAQFLHPLFTHVPVLNRIANLAIETDGGFYTVNRGAHFVWDPVRPYAHLHGSGFRAVYDLSDFSRSRFVIATGQSGNPFSAHYRDMLRLWRDGGGIRLGQSREDLEGAGAGRWLLSP
jgi:penicillin amidase